MQASLTILQSSIYLSATRRIPKQDLRWQVCIKPRFWRRVFELFDDTHLHYEHSFHALDHLNSWVVKFGQIVGQLIFCNLGKHIPLEGQQGTRLIVPIDIPRQFTNADLVEILRPWQTIPKWNFSFSVKWSSFSRGNSILMLTNSHFLRYFYATCFNEERAVLHCTGKS